MFKIMGIFLVSLLLLTGCGGGGGEGSGSTTETTKTAYFIDSAVKGLTYITESKTGNNTTGDGGSFEYSSNDKTITFKVGNITLGTMNVSNVNSDKRIFVQDLVGVDRTDTTNSTVLGVAKLLQTLDSDSTTDEIEILAEDLNKFDDSSGSIEDIDVAQILSDKGFPSITNDDVKRHMKNSLKYYEITEDNESPELQTSSISNGTIDVLIDSDIVLTFSDDLRKNLINNSNIQLKDSDNNSIPFSIEHYFNILTINPTDNLSHSKEYILTVKVDLQDYGKNPLTNESNNVDTVISFTTKTADTTAPVLNSTTQTYTTTVGTSLTLQTVTANDTVYGDITVVQSGDTPDFDTAGTYNVIYTATDNEGNSASITHTYDVIAKVIVLKTGQTISYVDYDDGHYQKGEDRSYTRGSEIVIDQTTSLQWQDDADAKNITKTWEEAKTYCEDKSLGGFTD
ncbi:MAG: hypothetical protein GY932_14620, partial [Arcobacter sp.]|nr:hypothetical protein [Arcobacter sp.]